MSGNTIHTFMRGDNINEWDMNIKGARLKNL